MWAKLAAAGVRPEPRRDTEDLEIPPAGLVGIRVSSAGERAMGGRRVVVAGLDGIALVRQESGQLLLGGLRTTAAQRAWNSRGLVFAGAPERQD